MPGDRYRQVTMLDMLCEDNTHDLRVVPRGGEHEPAVITEIAVSLARGFASSQ